MYSIYCFSETWLSDHILDKEIIPSNFTLYRKDRSTRGGGVLIAVRESITSTFVNTRDDLEVLAVRLDHLATSSCALFIYLQQNQQTIMVLLQTFWDCYALPMRILLLLETSITQTYVGLR